MATGDKPTTDKAAEAVVQSLQKLTKELSNRDKGRTSEEQLKLLNEKISALEGVFSSKSDESTNTLRDAYEHINEKLKTAIEKNDSRLLTFAEKQLNELQKSTDSVEKEREAQKEAKKSTDLTELMVSKITSLNDKFEGIASGIASKGSFLAKLIPLGLLILSQVDREKFLEVMEWIKNAFVDLLGVFKTIWEILKTGLPEIFSGISLILEGDISGGLTKLKDNFGLIASIIGLISVKMFGLTNTIIGVVRIISFAAKVISFAAKVIKFFGVFFTKTLIPAVYSFFTNIMTSSKGLIVAAYGKLSTFLKAFRLFTTATLIPAIYGMLSGIVASLTPMLVAAAPFIAIAAAVGLALYGIYELLDYVGKKLGFSGIGDLLKVGVAYLQDGFAHIANFIIDIINGAINAISGIAKKVAGWFGFKVDLPKGEFERLATDNAERISAELKEKEANRKAQEELEKSNQPTESDVPNSNIITPNIIIPETNFQMPDFSNMDMGSIEGIEIPEQNQSGLAPSGLPVIPSDNSTGFDIDALSNMNNAELQSMMTGAKSGTSIVTAPVMNAPNNSSTVTNVVQSPSSRTSMLMGSYSYAR